MANAQAGTESLSPDAKPEVAERSNVTVAPKKSKAKPYIILGVIVALGVGGYVGFRTLTAGKESTDDAQVDADVVAVSARVQGRVLKVYVSDNQTVKKGDLLAELDPVDLQAAANEAEAQLAAARAQAAAADAQVRIVEATSKGGLSAAKADLWGSGTSLGSADASVNAAKAAVDRANAEAAKADNDLKRAEALRKDDAIPQAQYDTIKANDDAAHAAVAQAQALLSVAQQSKETAQTRVAEAQGRLQQSAPVDAQLDVAKANAELAHARVKSAEASLEVAKLQLSYTHIESPGDGVLSKLAVHEGQLVQGGQEVVALVPSATYVVANFKETQVGEMQNGQRAIVEVDAFPGRKFEGVVVSSSPGTGARFSLLPPDNASGNFVKVVQRVPVKIAWKSVPGDVHPAAGMSADVTVYTR